MFWYLLQHFKKSFLYCGFQHEYNEICGGRGSLWKMTLLWLERASPFTEFIGFSCSTRTKPFISIHNHTFTADVLYWQSRILRYNLPGSPWPLHYSLSTGMSRQQREPHHWVHTNTHTSIHPQPQNIIDISYAWGFLGK